MKKKMIGYVAGFVLVFSMFFFSCNDAPVKDSKKEDVSKEEKKDTAQKDKGSKNTLSAEKGVTKKWIANAAAAQIKFSVKGPFGTVNGTLAGLISTILFDEKNLPASSIHASVDTKTISTGIGLRDHDLQKEKYLDAEKHSVISFQSSRIEKSGKGYKAIGDLTMKGITKQVEIPFDFLENGNAGTFKGSFTIQREDFSVGKPGGSIGNTVSIDLEVPVTPK